MTKTTIILICVYIYIYIILIACVYIQQFNFIQRPYGTVVNTYAAQSGGCRFESLWGFGFSLKGAYYKVGYCGKKLS